MSTLTYRIIDEAHPLYNTIIQGELNNNIIRVVSPQHLAGMNIRMYSVVYVTASEARKYVRRRI